MTKLNTYQRGQLFGKEYAYDTHDDASPQPPSPKQAWIYASEDNSVDEINDFLEEAFHPYTAFASTVPNSKEAIAAADKIHDRVDRIAEIVAETQYRIRRERQQLEREVNEFFGTTSSEPDWYLTDSLLDLPCEEMGKILRSSPPSSAAALEAFIRARVPADPSVFLEEHGNEIVPIRGDFWAGILELVEAFPALQGGVEHGLRICVLLTECLVKYYLWYQEAHDRSLLTALRRTLEAPGSVKRFTAQERLLLVGAARQCREAYISSQESCQYSEPRGTPRCGHTESAAIVQYLQIKAHGEIRTKILLTIGTLLPADVVELVIEAALVAEGLSVNPLVCVTVKGKADVRPEYVCEVMKDLKTRDIAWENWTSGLRKSLSQRMSTATRTMETGRKRSRPEDPW